MEYKNELFCGDCIELAKELPPESIRCMMCSPPYAEQRKKLYGGISETDFPEWTVKWMEPLKKALADDGSVLIVIRPHIRNGCISDYVLKTRLAVRSAGWVEAEELIWHKPDAPPLGSTKRPRRAWEKILWFSKNGKPFVNLKACGNEKSTRTGGFAGSDRFGEGGDSPIAANQTRTLKKGTSRITDVFTAHIGEIERGIMHPAMYPETLTDQLVQTFSEKGDTIADFFMGSGTTAISSRKFDRNYVGFESDPTYVELAKSRIIQRFSR